MDESQKNKAFLHGLVSSGCFTDTRLKILRQRFSSFQAAWNSDLNFLLRADSYNNFLDFRNHWDTYKEWDLLERQAIKTISFEELDYPKLLKEVTSAPELLYYRGTLSSNLLPIAMVGSRKMTSYGKMAIAEITKSLAGFPILIISGLALGADACAHQNSLANGIKTIAILGSGLDDNSIYPRENLQLAKKILDKGGALVSQFVPGYKATRYSFPERNRIISGMSKGTIIYEAGIKSGALITADFALEQNRDIFALPGPIYNTFSEGTNNLIKSGAYPITSGKDLIEFYNLKAGSYQEDQKDTNLSENAYKILSLLKKSPANLEEILSLTGLHISVVLAALSQLEISERIYGDANNFYQTVLTRSKQHR